MNRIFKNAVFPILVVILLAFLAQRLLLNNDSTEAPPKNWSTLLGDLKDGDVTALDQNVNSNDVKVTLKPVDGKAAENYTVGIPGDAAWEQMNGFFTPGYATSKAGLNMLSLIQSKSLADKKIAVASAHPGWVKTDMGGPDAPVEVKDSTRGLADTIARHAGQPGAVFVDYQGNVIAW